MTEKPLAKITEAMGAMPRSFVAVPEASYGGLDDQVHDQLVRELHTYPRKNVRISLVLWVFAGFLGVHRIYLGQLGYGLLMMLTGGGLLVWWLIDGFRLRKMVEAFNEEQAKRQEQDQPPIGMEFVPVVTSDTFHSLPAWADRRLYKNGVKQSFSRLLSELTADIVALLIFGYILGSITAETEYRAAAYAVIVMAFMINFVDYLLPYHNWPIARGMIHWDYKLRLYYHFNEPGKRWKLYLRPLFGILTAPFNKKSRSEVLLYLELGSVFIVGRAIIGLYNGNTWDLIVNMDLLGFAGSWISGLFLGFITVFGFAGPIGAILMKHVLLRRPNYARWGLSFVVMWFLLLGYFT